MPEMGTMQQINSEPLRTATVLTPQSQAEQYAREAQQAAAQAAQSATDAQTAAESAEQAVAGAVKYSEAQTLTAAQQAQARENIGAGDADAEEVADLKSAMGNLDDLRTEDKSTLVAAINEAAISGGGGLTDAVKSALLQIFTKVAYVDEHGQDYYDDLYDALYSVTEVLLNSHSIMLNTLGATSQLTARTIPEGGQITWTSSNPAIATVDQTGLVTSVAYGNSTITATSGSVSDMCSVTISQVTLESIEAVYTPSGTVYNTDSLDSLKGDLEVTATWSDGSTTTVSGEDYTLSGTLAVGNSTVTVSYGGQTGTFTVTVVGVTSITATYTQSGNVYADTPLDSLKADLVVAAHYDDGTSAVVTNYALSGTLSVGTSMIVVSYGDKTDSFTVTVSKYVVYTYKYSDGDLLKAIGGVFYDTAKYNGKMCKDNKPARRSFWISDGEKPAFDTSTNTESNYYPIPIPPTATSVTVSISPSTQYIGVSFWVIANNEYTRTLDPGWAHGSFSRMFAAGTYQYLGITCKYDSAGSSYPVEPTDMVIEFA